jgi:hypothetical protein
MFFLYIQSKKITWSILGSILLVFLIILIIIHNKLKIKILRLDHWIMIKKSNLARISLDWEKIPENAQPILQNHPFAHDLDIIGKYSLYRLLDTTFSVHGAEYLKKWLLNQNNDLAELGKRQNLVQELTPLSLFRDKLILESSLMSQSTINGERLIAQLKIPAFYSLPKVLRIETFLILLTYILFLGRLFFQIQPFWIISWLIYIFIFFYFSLFLAPLFNRAQSIQIELKRLKAIFFQIEKRSYCNRKYLSALCDVFLDKNIRPSSYLKKMTLICDTLSIRAHFLVHLGVNMLCPWDLLFSHVLEKTRKQMLKNFSIWLDRLGILEAAASLANFAHNNLNYVMPVIFKPDEANHDYYFKANDISHPLIAPTKRVTNDFVVKKSTPLALITGSNMSGKSTFLRTIGINICLAQAGAPTCATMFHAPWFKIYSCIRIDDSITEELSYFYAEVKRLKLILDKAFEEKSYSVFVLIDEIFKGTNNRERIIGSRFYIKALAKAKSLALITTHDLEITQIVNEMDEIENYHFQEIIKDDKMSFDYNIREGAAKSTNALRIMNIEGLPIPSFDKP